MEDLSMTIVVQKVCLHSGHHEGPWSRLEAPAAPEQRFRGPSGSDPCFFRGQQAGSTPKIAGVPSRKAILSKFVYRYVWLRGLGTSEVAIFNSDQS